MPGYGILRIDGDLRRQELIPLPDKLKPLNFHGTKIGQINGSWKLVLPANSDALVAVVSLDGKLEFILSKPEFEQYQGENIAFAPTDTTIVADRLYVADGYGRIIFPLPMSIPGSGLASLAVKLKMGRPSEESFP